jgi:hypothetical protein
LFLAEKSLEIRAGFVPLSIFLLANAFINCGRMATGSKGCMHASFCAFPAVPGSRQSKLLMPIDDIHRRINRSRVDRPLAEILFADPTKNLHKYHSPVITWLIPILTNRFSHVVHLLFMELGIQQ